MTNSSPSVAIAIFAKTIGLSPVKTRLAASIGTQQAEQFYRLSLACSATCVREVQAQHDNVDVYWATAEEHAHQHQQWQGQQTLWTGNGELGQRLHHIYQQLQQQYDIVILLGSDCPHLSSQRIIEAINSVQKHTQPCLGPAEDGGFYLFAAATPLPQTMWTSVSYSQADTREQLLRAINVPVKQLTYCFDIDTIDELRRLKNGPLTATIEAQAMLAKWLQALDR